MDALEQVRRLYEAYQIQFRQREQARRPGEGIFGLGMGPRSYPCHGQFARDLEGLLRTITEERPSSSQVRELLEYIYAAPLERPEGEDAVYWMLLAAHGLTLDLMDQLAPADARSLLDRYQSAYPRRKRMDAQDRVLSALRARAKSE